MFRLGKTSTRNLNGVNNDLIRVINRALQISKVDFGIPLTGGVRDARDQWELFIAGKSMANGYDDISKHQTGGAFDIFAYVDNKANYEPLNIAMCACAILQAASEMGVRIRWGGHFKSIMDMPHFELA